MNRSILALALAALVAAPAFAAEDHSAHAMHGTASAGSAALSEGIVKKIDKTAGTVTLAHGPLKSLDMGPMTMSFAVADKAALARLKVGDKLRFLAEEKNGALTASRIELAK